MKEKQTQEVHFWISCRRHCVFPVLAPYACRCRAIVVCLAAMKPGGGAADQLVEVSQDFTSDRAHSLLVH